MVGQEPNGPYRAESRVLSGPRPSTWALRTSPTGSTEKRSTSKQRIFKTHTEVCYAIGLRRESLDCYSPALCKPILHPDGVPDSDRHVSRGGDHPFAVAGKCNRVNVGVVAAKFGHHLTSRRIAETNHIVGTGAGHT